MEIGIRKFGRLEGRRQESEKTDRRRQEAEGRRKQLTSGFERFFCPGRFSWCDEFWLLAPEVGIGVSFEFCLACDMPEMRSVSAGDILN